MNSASKLPFVCAFKTYQIMNGFLQKNTDFSVTHITCNKTMAQSYQMAHKLAKTVQFFSSTYITFTLNYLMERFHCKLVTCIQSNSVKSITIIFTK